MIRHGIVAISLALVLSPAAFAQAWQFRWEKGDVIVSKVEHQTLVVETIAGKPSEITSKLTITKKWRVVDVDSEGTATLEQSLVSLRNEQSRPGSKLLFDSDNPDVGTPELKGMMKHINVPIAAIRVDRIGRVVQVQSGPKVNYDAEPPFALILPGQPVREGQAWVRPFTVTLEPPLGLGEKYQAEHLAKLVKIDGTKATIQLAATIKNPPDAASEQVPLLQKQMSGAAVFDTARGRLESVRLSVDKTVENHQGNNSSYRFASTYVEQVVSPTIMPTSGTR